MPSPKAAADGPVVTPFYGWRFLVCSTLQTKIFFAAGGRTPQSRQQVCFHSTLMTMSKATFPEENKKDYKVSLIIRPAEKMES